MEIVAFIGFGFIVAMAGCSLHGAKHARMNMLWTFVLGLTGSSAGVLLSTQLLHLQAMALVSACLVASVLGALAAVSSGDALVAVGLHQDRAHS